MKKNRFNLTDKLYQKSIFPFVNEFINNNKCNSPAVVDLDLTTFCDLACPECISNPVLNTVSFDKKEMLAIVDEIINLGVKAVILIGGGEPLLHKDASKVITTLGEAGIKIGLVTNGTLIHKHIDAISNYVTWTRVSIDAGIQKTYDKFRPARKEDSTFDKIIQNMRLLAKSKKGDLGYSFLLMSRREETSSEKSSIIDTNYYDVEDAGKLAKDIGCDYFELKSIFDEDHNVMKQPVELINEAKEKVKILREIENDTFKVYDSFTFSELIENTNNTNPVKKYSYCPVTELRTTITPHGIYPCAYHRNNTSMQIGNLKNSSLKEIWNNKEKKVNPITECTFECARDGINMEIISMMNNNNKSTIELEDDYDLFI